MSANRESANWPVGKQFRALASIGTPQDGIDSRSNSDILSQNVDFSPQRRVLLQLRAVCEGLSMIPRTTGSTVRPPLHRQNMYLALFD